MLRCDRTEQELKQRKEKRVERGKEWRIKKRRGEERLKQLVKSEVILPLKKGTEVKVEEEGTGRRRKK